MRLRLRLGFALAVSLGIAAGLVGQPVAASPARSAQYVAVRLTAGRADLRLELSLRHSSDSVRDMAAFVALRSSPRGGLTPAAGFAGVTGGGGPTPSAYAVGTVADCGAFCSVTVTRVNTVETMSIRDSGADRITRVLLAVVGRATVRVSRSDGWRVRKVTSRFVVAESRHATAAGADAGSVGVEALLRLDLVVRYGPAVGVARVPCPPEPVSGDATPPPRLRNGVRDTALRCTGGGTSALVGDGTSRWSLEGPAIGFSRQGAARLVVFPL